MSSSGPHYNAEEVAKLFGVSIRTVTSWAVAYQDSGAKEGIPGFKIGRAWLFDREQINELIREKKRLFQPIRSSAASA